ncbi:MAG: tetratricopeptide repeat protein [Candidatus Latescibacteria bacterium]|nr:tetratricopeptide repeat protein [Candidatus Latescibacterota bacterium]MBT4137163.1 tetratricopeptide repeat protein [Candidatus Latescibacterota bacterium]MBT5829227.1 tetratricopeptide repeat protein [Candidatus Latescibacterota bacterium]
MKRLILMCLLLVGFDVAYADRAKSSFEAANKARDTGDLLQALDHYEAALNSEPNNLKYGNDYRQAVVQINQVESYERCIAFFEKLTTQHTKIPNVWMNFGYAYVDKIPVEGAITQVLLANTALGYFSKALELEDSWLGHYTRGNSYLYWPAIFGRTPLAIEDLEKAIALSEKEKKSRSFHVRPYVGLGEAHWRLDDVTKAREIWKSAAKRFPDNEDLKKRLSMDDEALTAFLTTHFEPGKRVNTDLNILWEEEQQ